MEMHQTIAAFVLCYVVMCFVTAFLFEVSFQEVKPSFPLLWPITLPVLLVYMFVVIMRDFVVYLKDHF